MRITKHIMSQEPDTQFTDKPLGTVYNTQRETELPHEFHYTWVGRTKSSSCGILIKARLQEMITSDKYIGILRKINNSLATLTQSHLKCPQSMSKIVWR